MTTVLTNGTHLPQITPPSIVLESSVENHVKPVRPTSGLLFSP